MLVWFIIANGLTVIVLIMLQVANGKRLRQVKKLLLQQKEAISSLNNKLEGKENAYSAQLHSEWRSYMYLQCLEVISAIGKQKDSLHPRAIEHAPREQKLTNEQLASIFAPKQLQALFLFWDKYETYLSHWFTDKGKIKVVFADKDMQQLKQLSSQVKQELEDLLVEIAR